MVQRPDIWERVQADIDAGNIVGARHRLISWIGNAGPDDEVAIRIGALSLERGEPVIAGQWWFLTSASGPDIEEAVEAFVGSGSERDELAMRLPKVMRIGRAFEDLPEVAQSRFLAHAGGEAEWKRASTARSPERLAPLMAVVALMVVLGVAFVFVVGIVTVIGWVF